MTVPGGFINSAVPLFKFIIQFHESLAGFGKRDIFILFLFFLIVFICNCKHSILIETIFSRLKNKIYKCTGFRNYFLVENYSYNSNIEGKNLFGPFLFITAQLSKMWKSLQFFCIIATNICVIESPVDNKSQVEIFVCLFKNFKW